MGNLTRSTVAPEVKDVFNGHQSELVQKNQMKSEEHYVVSKDDLQTRNQNIVQPESSSVDTEIEVSIKNANLLTNLAKVV